MSSTILEQIRSNHENLEVYEKAVMQELDVKPSGVYELIVLNLSSHFAFNYYFFIYIN